MSRKISIWQWWDKPTFLCPLSIVSLQDSDHSSIN